MDQKRITRIIIFVRDMPLMREFYHGVIGLPIVGDESDSFVTLDAGGCQLALHRIPPELAGESIEPREDSYVKIAFGSIDVETEREELVNAGVRMKDTVRWNGVDFCDGADPEGNIFQLSSRTR